KLVGQLIELEADTQELVKILQENSRCPSAQKIRYRDGKRWVADWSEVQDIPTEGECPWKDGGVYLITGGAGGLGLIFAQEIANQVRDATLILTGRSPLDAQKQEWIKRLGVQGTQVTYEQVDVTQRQAVCDLIQRIQQDYGNLDGIIHSAGVIRDNFLLKKTRDEIAHVLAPKVTGLVNLDQASKDIPLDFFLLFSALAGAFGSVGQTDYAAANVFMDEYARYRNYLVASQQRWGKTLSINWPLWKDGGMKIDAEAAKVLSENAGMVPMETSAGIRALYQGFALAEDQVLILEGSLSKLKAYGSDRTGKAPSYPATEAYLQIDPVRLREKVIQQIKVQFSAITKLSVAHIDAHEPLESYGIDSLKIVQLNQRFAAIFGELSKTLFFEYRTLDELATYFMEDYQQACIEWTGLKEEAISSMSRPSVSKQHIERVFPTPISLRRGEKQAHSISIADSGKPEREPIAIIGIAGRYPGARNLKDYWKNLKAGQSSITEIPAERWPLEGFYHADINEAVKQGKSYSKWGGFVEGFADFDPLFFRISPQEAQSIDPQERLFIETCWAALEDAGYTREQLGVQCHHKVGVFAGITKTGFSLYGPDLWKRGKDRDDLHLLHPSTSFGSVANRVSYLLNLQGPSMPIDTMCSSSLTALHEACEHIYRGECKMALAGGVNLYLHPANYIFLCAQNMLSVDGLCKSFGQGGNGFVPGEGVGVVVLKRLSEAIADHDQIYAVIRATGINHGGTTNGYTVPNPTAQGELIHSTLSKAGISARTVSYIEGHGTGTELGDPIEVTGLTQAFHRDTQEIGFCALGSVKSNIGHLEAAAGIAGVTKIVLQMKYQKIVPSLHAKTINPNINSTKIPFVLQQELTDWKRPLVELNGEGRLYPRIAGISSFGAGGANAHLVLEEYIPDTHPRTAITVDAHNPAIIVLSARNEEQLKKRAQQLLEEIVDQQLSDENLADLAYTLQVGREAMQERLAVVAGSMKKLAEKLEQFVEDQDGIVDVYRGQVKRYKEALAVLDVDDDIGIAIDAWVSKKKYGKLLDLWVKGLAFDWNKLYGDVKPYRISLPTYPFARERYWLPTSAMEVVRSSCSLTNTCGENQSEEPRIQAVAALHPLVQSNTSSESGTIPAIPAISQPLLSQNPLQPSRQRSRSDATKPDEILAFTISYLVNILSTVLKISPEKLDREVGFDEYGLDSIIIARLHPMIEVVFGPIPSTTFFQYKCITDLAHYFLKEHKETLNALFQQRSKSQSLQWEEMRQDQPQKGSSLG
ncbi:MAG: SDR family NAD(P)-dependent oxidoreductase, partial [Chloroflexi bacterium]